MDASRAHHAGTARHTRRSVLAALTREVNPDIPCFDPNLFLLATDEGLGAGKGLLGVLHNSDEVISEACEEIEIVVVFRGSISNQWRGLSKGVCCCLVLLHQRSRTM